jgi:catechol 2,3-dioxygenase-like lactoylglutathione lyase family enzyme
MLITSITPQRRTRDLDASIRFYTEKGGLALEFRHADFYAGIRAGDQVFHLKRIDSPDPSIALVQAGDHLHPYLGTHNVDAVAEMLKHNGVTLDREPTHTPWHAHELAFLDDQGHTIYVGQKEAAAA